MRRGKDATMRRETRQPRANWRQRCEEAGFSFHSMGGTYWDESASYRFLLPKSTSWNPWPQRCTSSASRRPTKRCARSALPSSRSRRRSTNWSRNPGEQREPTLYGRFDFSWNGEGEPKLLEYNADTPTALLEASVVQWHWLEDVQPDADQFNSLHEKLIERLQGLQPAAGRGVLHLACVRNNDEDLGTVEYLRDCALQAGWDARQIAIEDLGWDGARFVDLDEAPVTTPVQALSLGMAGARGVRPAPARPPGGVIEPAWKMLLSNKALLVLLWEMNYGHPNLLPAYFTPQKFGADYVRKPLLSREGANVTIRSRGVVREQPGGYGGEGFVYQGVAPLPAFDGRYPVIGAWIVGDAARRHRHPRGRFADHQQLKPLRAPLLHLEVPTMDFVKFSLAGFDEFLIYAGLAIAFIYLFMIAYLRAHALQRAQADQGRQHRRGAEPVGVGPRLHLPARRRDLPGRASLGHDALGRDRRHRAAARLRRRALLAP